MQRKGQNGELFFVDLHKGLKTFLFFMNLSATGASCARIFF